MAPKLVLLTPAVFLAQAAFVGWASSAERPPAIPVIERFAPTLNDWRAPLEVPIAQDVRDTLRADLLISQNYPRKDTGAQANLLVAWFQTQTMGARQPHSPQVCLPGSGWTPILSDHVMLNLEGGPTAINRYVASFGGQQAVVLYWYQTAQRVVASEWASKFWTMWDALHERRTDIALVRVVTWPTGTDPQKATQEGLALANDLYPQLRAALPR